MTSERKSDQIAHSEMTKSVPKNQWKVLITIALGTIMGAMDFSMVNLAFPKLTQVFHTNIGAVVWVTLAYTLTNTSLLLIVGKFGDLLGRKRLYIVGEILFNCGILACAFSQSIAQLIWFRVFMGVGASMIFSAGPALLADALPPKNIGKGMGLLNASISAGFIIGPVVGGMLLNWIDWRSIFYVRLPFGVLATVMSVMFLKPDRSTLKSLQFDKVGMMLSVSGLFCLVFGVNQISRLGLTSWAVIGLVGLGLALLFAFVLTEQRATDPILDFSLFKNTLFRYSSLSLFVFFIAAPVFVLILPFLLIQGYGLNPSQSGLLLSVASVAGIVIGPISGTLSDRYGEILFASLGVAILILGYNILRVLDETTPILALVPLLFMLGGASGMYQTPNNSAIIRSVPKKYLGTASALISMLRGVGLAIGMALIGAVFAARQAIRLSQLENNADFVGDVTSQSVIFSAHDTILVGVSIFGISLLLTLTPLVVSRSRK